MTCPQGSGDIRPQLKTRPLGSTDLWLVAILAGSVAYFIWRLINGFNYQWDWGSLPQFLVRLDGETETLAAGPLLKGLLVTLKLGLWSAILAFFIGLILALGRLSSRPYFVLVSRTIIEICRNLPPLVLILIFYYFISEQFGLWDYLADQLSRQSVWWQSWVEFFWAGPDQLNAFTTSVITLGFYEGAYFAEIIRGGILSINSGQWEASYCLGLSAGQRLRLVILPQTLRRIWPQLAGQFISTIKDSSIVSIISVGELTFAGSQLIQSTQMTIETWTAVALLYFLLTFGLSLLARKLELRNC